MSSHKIAYFEQSTIWEKDFLTIPAQKKRIGDTANAIPHDTRSILDVGCGNGTFINFLVNISQGRFSRIVGTDSKKTLRHVKAEAAYGDITTCHLKIIANRRAYVHSR